MTVQRTIHALADFITRPTRNPRRGDLARDQVDVQKLLADLVDAAATKAADKVERRQQEREQRRLADLEALREAFEEFEPEDRQREAMVARLTAEQDNLRKLLATRDRDYHDAVNECERARKERDSALEKLGHWRNQFALTEETDDQAIAHTVDVARKAHEDIVQARKDRDVAIAERNAAADLLSLIARQCWPDESGPFRPDALAKIPDRVRALRLIYEDRTKQ